MGEEGRQWQGGARRVKASRRPQAQASRGPPRPVRTCVYTHVCLYACSVVWMCVDAFRGSSSSHSSSDCLMCARACV